MILLVGEDPWSVSVSISTRRGESLSPDMPGKLIMDPGSSALARTPIGDYRDHVRAVIEGALTRADESLSGPFTGVTVAASTNDDLFPIQRTGLSLDPVIDAARRLLESLSVAEREIISFAVDDDYNWRAWHNMHFFLMRHGLGMHEMTAERRERVFDLLRASMSASGFDNARDVMRLNEHAAELTGRHDEYGEFYYWISVFGTPSSNEPWGWQIDGHHLIINCMIVGDQIVMTPDFRGSEPVKAESGQFAGTRVFADEEAKGLRLMRSFDGAQRQIATISPAPPREVITTAQADNLALDRSGVSFTSLATHHQDYLVELISLYTNRIRPGHAEVRLEEVKRHLNDTYFAWMGGCDSGDAFYYRITNPVILIEFDHLPGIIYDNREPTRRHVHSIVRTPNGNDYGRSLLLEHYRRHDHGDPNSTHRQGNPRAEHSSTDHQAEQ